MIDLDVDVERRVFERWYRETFGVKEMTTVVDGNPLGTYFSHHTQTAWQAWLSRAELA